VELSLPTVRHALRALLGSSLIPVKPVAMLVMPAFGVPVGGGQRATLASIALQAARARRIAQQDILVLTAWQQSVPRVLPRTLVQMVPPHAQFVTRDILLPTIPTMRLPRVRLSV